MSGIASRGAGSDGSLVLARTVSRFFSDVKRKTGACFGRKTREAKRPKALRPNFRRVRESMPETACPAGPERGPTDRREL